MIFQSTILALLLASALSALILLWSAWFCGADFAPLGQR